MSYRFDTLAIHAGQPNDAATGAVNVPIYQTSTFQQNEPGVHRGFGYSRTEHPTRRALEVNLAALEGSEFGLAFASGMAAIHNVLSLLRAGDHVVTTQDLYGGAWRIFVRFFAKFGIDFTFVDTSDVAAVERAFKPETRLLWLETPSNPLLKVTDIAACAEIARRRGCRTVVDNTFATPVLQRPLELGADIVVHSTTKYINGHSDCLGGCVITNDRSVYDELKFFQNAVGAVPGPNDCYLILRGVKTLSLRVRQQSANAAQIADALRNNPAVGAVHYPGFGAIVSFETADAKAFARTTHLWTLAESLGGVKSLFCHPATMTHASMDADARRRAGIGDGLIRLSVGLEDVRDLVEDLEQALTGSAACAK